MRGAGGIWSMSAQQAFQLSMKVSTHACATVSEQHLTSMPSCWQAGQ